MESKKTIHFFDQNNKISRLINTLYKDQYQILRKEQYYSLIIIEGIKALEKKDFNSISLADLKKVLNFRD